MKPIRTDDEWREEYIPKENHLDNNAAFNGCMYETFGPEVSFIWQYGKNNPNNVWTLVDAEEELYIIAGMHFVNRMGYFITEKPWEHEMEQYLIT